MSLFEGATQNEATGIVLFGFAAACAVLLAIIALAAIVTILVLPAADRMACRMAGMVTGWIDRQGFLFKHEATDLPYSANQASEAI